VSVGQAVVRFARFKLARVASDRVTASVIRTTCRVHRALFFLPLYKRDYRIIFRLNIKRRKIEATEASNFFALKIDNLQFTIN
jgi:hypothetical protein